MRNYTILFSCFLAVLGFIFMSSSGGRANIFNEDRTGSPLASGQFCGQCHAGGNFSPIIEFVILDSAQNVIFEYEPGQTYSAMVLMSNGGGSTPSGFGFQASILQANNSMAGNFSNPGTGAQISTVNQVEYAEQTGPKANGIFEFEWTAPSAGTGTLTMYAAGNAVNGNGQSTGDASVKLTPTTLTEKTSIGIAETQEISLRIFPIPAKEEITLDLNQEVRNPQLSFIGLDGKVFEAPILTSSLQKGANQIQTGHLSSGVYFLKLQSDSGVQTQKFIKY